jgi:hypothetical protein
MIGATTSKEGARHAYSLKRLNLKQGRVERSSAAVHDGTVEELVSIGIFAPDGDLQILFPKQYLLFARAHIAREREPDFVELIQTQLNQLFFGLLVVGGYELVVDFAHRNPTFLYVKIV